MVLSNLLCSCFVAHTESSFTDAVDFDFPGKRLGKRACCVCSPCHKRSSGADCLPCCCHAQAQARPAQEEPRRHCQCKYARSPTKLHLRMHTPAVCKLGICTPRLADCWVTQGGVPHAPLMLSCRMNASTRVRCCMTHHRNCQRANGCDRAAGRSQSQPAAAYCRLVHRSSSMVYRAATEVCLSYSLLKPTPAATMQPGVVASGN